LNYAENYYSSAFSRTARKKGTAMAKASDYTIVVFQRKPGRWRASVTPNIQPAARTQGAVLGFVTTEDSGSEESAVIAADKAIKELDS
jgi:hypothetical protein